MRTVDGSRHDFVDRQNEILLEYRAKEGVYTITLNRTLDRNRNIFEFRLTDGFGRPAAGAAVNLAADNGAIVLDPGAGLPTSRITADADGVITVQLRGSGPNRLTLGTGRTSKTFEINVTPSANLALAVTAAPPHAAGAAVDLTATLLDGRGLPLPGVNLTWEVATDPAGVTLTHSGSPTDPSGQATATVVSVTAKTVTVRVSATVDGAIHQVEVPVTVEPRTVSLTLAVTSAPPHVAGAAVDLTATLLDGQGLPLAGVDLTWQVISDPTGVTLIPSGYPTDASGQVPAKVASATAKTVTVRVSAMVDGVLRQTSLDVVFIP